MPPPVRLPPALAAALDALRRSYGARELESDPLRYVRRFRGRQDRELAGFLASGLAFGRVAAIFRSLEDLFGRLDHQPARAAQELPRDELRRLLSGFRHRWVGGRAVAEALVVLGSMLRARGSLEPFFFPGASTPQDVRDGVACFTAEARGRATLAGDHGFDFLFPAPGGGGACKRINLFLRWMVRRDDGLDLGLWSRLRPAQLVIPLDTHVAFLGRALGLTRRRTAGWAMAAEITDALRTLDPEDPVKYDWALSRLGILGHCPERRDRHRCPPCPLFGHCTLGREVAARARPAVRRREVGTCPSPASR